LNAITRIEEIACIAGETVSAFDVDSLADGVYSKASTFALIELAFTVQAIVVDVV